MCKPRILRFFSLFVILLPRVLFGISVDIFNVGQGNGVLASHNNQAIMIDCGMGEYQFAALRHERALAQKSTPKEFALENDTAKDHNTLAKQSSEDTHGGGKRRSSSSKRRLF